MSDRVKCPMCSQLDDPHYRNAYRPPEHVKLIRPTKALSQRGQCVLCGGQVWPRRNRSAKRWHVAWQDIAPEVAAAFRLHGLEGVRPLADKKMLRRLDALDDKDRNYP